MITSESILGSAAIHFGT